MVLKENNFIKVYNLSDFAETTVVLLDNMSNTESVSVINKADLK